MQPVDVSQPGRGQFVVLVAERVGDGLGEVLGQIANSPVRLRCTTDEALHVRLAAEPQHMRGPGVLVVVEFVEGLVPGGQRGVGVGVDVGLGLVVRHWNVGAGVDVRSCGGHHTEA